MVLSGSMSGRGVGDREVGVRWSARGDRKAGFAVKGGAGAGIQAENDSNRIMKRDTT